MQHDATFFGSVDESVRRRFEAAWREGVPVSIEVCLPATDDVRFQPTLEELVQIEMEFAWKSRNRSGRSSPPALVERYLERFPVLNDPATVQRLLLHEFRLRHLHGDSPSADEYRSRFPELAPTGKELFQETGTRQLETTFPRIPGYEILGVIGRGGMGVVYKALQVQLGRTVALKMVSGGQADPEDRSRFRKEAEAIARFQDPNIVHIYEVGECAGRLYFSMELISGGSLDKRLAKTPQPARESAELVDTLARAMHRVHERGLVHRDLKPGNVLIEETRVGGKRPPDFHQLAPDSWIPKISDFGLAKRTEGAGETATGAILGTPSYMAPEQASGEAKSVGPAADVYALGAMLYEMLTGRAPFLGTSPVDTMMQVRTEEPVPPRRLQPKLPRDLETICLKCLEKDPARRYGSAQDLADDLGRFVRDEPIRARPVSRVERVWRWSRRNPLIAGPLATLAVIIPLALVGLGVLWLQSESHRLEAETNLDIARRNNRKAHDAVDQLLTHLGYDKLVDVPSMEPVVREMMETALRFNQGFLETEGTDPAARFETARAYRRAGTIQRMLGQHAQAEQRFRKALELLDTLVADFPDDENRREHALSTFLLASLAAGTGRLDEAERWHRQTLSVRQRLAAAHPLVADYLHEAADSYQALGRIWRDASRLAEADKAFQRAVELRRQALALAPSEPQQRWKLAGSLDALADYLEWTGKPKQALAQRAEGLEVLDRLVVEFPDDPRYREDLSILEHNQGLVHDLGRPDVVEPLYRDALKHQERLVEAFPSRPRYRELSARSHYLLGGLLLRTGRLVDAENALRRALDVQEKLVAVFPLVADYRAQLAQTHAVLRTLLASTNRAAGLDLISAYKKAVELNEHAALDHPEVVAYQFNLALHLDYLGRALADTSQNKEAEKVLRRATEAADKLLKRLPTVAEYRLRTAASANQLGIVLWRSSRPNEAEEAYRQAFALLRKLADDFPTVPAYQRELSVAQHNLAILFRNSKRPNEAEEWHRKNLELLERLVADVPDAQEFRRSLCDTYTAFGLLLVATDRHGEAEKGYQRALELEGQLLAASDSPDVHSARAATLDNYAESLLDRKASPKEALKLIEQAIADEQIALKANSRHPQYRLFMASHWAVLAETQLRLSRAQPAADAAREIPKLFPTDARQCRSAAGLLARCIPLIEKDAELRTDERAVLIQAYGEEAIKLLSQAIAQGFRNADDLSKSTDLQPIRTRPEFAKLLEKARK